ncbi:MAG: hypothetical protein P4L90_07425 [Rhodopila sp.]|nr:hypothetical protein [Rhodopila sp.]
MISAIAGEGAQHLRRLAVVEGVEAAAQCFAIDGDAGRDRPTFGGGLPQRRRVLAENPLTLRPAARPEAAAMKPTAEREVRDMRSLSIAAKK